MSETLKNVLQWFPQNTDSFLNQTSDWFIESFTQTFNSRQLLIQEKSGNTESLGWFSFDSFWTAFVGRAKIDNVTGNIVSKIIFFIKHLYKSNTDHTRTVDLVIILHSNWYLEQQLVAVLFCCFFCQGSQSINFCIHTAFHIYRAQTLVLKWNETKHVTLKKQNPNRRFALFQKTSTWHYRRGFGPVTELYRGALTTKESTTVCHR